MSLEIMILSCIFNLAVFSEYLDDLDSQAFILIIIIAAGAETAIGLSIILCFTHYLKHKYFI
jgi:NADH:ubiquinone oxidoreductase subunit K